MSTEYHKISTPFKRHFDGPNKGKLIMGDWAVPELEYLADNEWEFTEKVDGTNIRIEMRLSGGYLAVEHKGRTDNAVLPKPLHAHLKENFPTDPAWRESLSEPAYADRHEVLYDWMHSNGLDKVTLYGEGYGPNIQNGGNYREDQSFVLFDVKVGDWWLLRDDVDDIAEKLGIESVPVLGYGTLYEAINIVKYGYKTTNIHFGETPVLYGEGMLQSRWGDFEAEGIVARPTVPLFTRRGDRIITKIKAKDFR